MLSEYDAEIGELVCENCDVLPVIPEGIQDLIIIDSPKIRQIPNIVGLKKLSCENCRGLRELPNIVGLEELSCEKCPGLTVIPKIVGLQILSCNGCPGIREIPKIDGLQELSCEKCPGLTVIPKIVGLQILSCNGCTGIREIPKIDGLQELSCEKCPGLSEIPNILELQELQCNGCTSLTEIPNIIGLQNLDCNDCTGLTTIPKIDRLQELSCNGCIRLTEMPHIVGLKKLSCIGCIGLREIPHIVGLKELHCSGTRMTVPNIVGLRTNGCNVSRDAPRPVPLDIAPTPKNWQARKARAREYYNMVINEKREPDRAEFKEDPSIRTCSDIIKLEPEVNIVEFLKDVDALIFLRDSKFSMCYTKDHLQRIIEDKDQWLYECLGRETGRSARGVDKAITNFDLRYPYGLFPVGDFSVMIPIQRLNQVVRDKHRVYHMVKTGDITTTITHGTLMSDGSHVSSNHCQGGSNLILYNLVLCKGGGCSVTKKF
jgi:hypothetical protein